MRIRAILAACVLALAGAAFALPQPADAAGIKKLTTMQLGKYFPFAGMNVRVDKIETVAHADGRKLVDKIPGGFDHDKGYIMVTVTVQNPSDSDAIDMPQSEIGFELADGSQIEEGSPAGTFLASSYNDAPVTLHPKQHVQVVYALTEWSGQPLTKMFLHSGGGTELNDAGYLYVRFQLPQDYVKALAPQ